MHRKFDRKRIFNVFRAQGTCLIAAKCLSPSPGEPTALSSNPLAGLEGPVRGGKRKGEREGEGQNRLENTPLPTLTLPKNIFLVTAVHGANVSFTFAVNDCRLRFNV